MTQGRSDDDLHTVDLARDLVRRMDRDPEYVYRILTEVRDARIAAEARAVAAERGEDDQRAMLRDCRAEVAAAQAMIAAVEAERMKHQPCANDPAECDECGHPIRQWSGVGRCIVAECLDAAVAAASGVAPDKPAPTECNDERCVLPGAHDLGEFGCLVDPGVAPDQPNGDKR